MINTIKPDFFPENIKAALEKRKDKQSIANQKYIEVGRDMYNLL